MSPEMKNFMKFLARLAVEDYLQEVNYKGAANEICRSGAEFSQQRQRQNQSKNQLDSCIIESENMEDR